MEHTDLVVEVRDASLTRLGTITSDLLQLKFTPTLCAPGPWSLVLPAEVDAAQALLEPGAGIIITHTDPAVGPLFSGPVTSPLQKADRSDPQGTVEVSGQSDDLILWQRLAYPLPTTTNVAAQTVSHDVRTGNAETVMRAYVNANVGPGAPLARRAVTLAPNLNRGASQTRSARWDVLGELLADIATVAGLAFRVVQVGSVLEFQVYDPTDKSTLVRLDLWNGTLSSQSVQRTAATLTRAVVAGQGEMADRTFLEVVDTAAEAALPGPFQRYERYVDQRNTNDPLELTQAGQAAILEGAAQAAVTALPGDDQTMRYPQDWREGDVLGIVVDGQETAAQVTAVPIQVNREGVKVGASIGAVTGWDPQAGLRKDVKTMGGRVSKLERNTGTPSWLPELNTAWVAYTPTLTGITLGNGTLVARRKKIGTTMHVRGRLAFGSTTSITGPVTITLPQAAVLPNDQDSLGSSQVLDASAGVYIPGGANLLTSTTFSLRTDTGGIVQPGAPMAFATGDALGWNLTYEVAPS